jgi:hypothetical protein
MATWRCRSDVALHEAAHCVVAVALGVAVDRVVIDGTGSGGMCHLGGEYDPRKEGVVYWAGALAEARDRQGSPYVYEHSWVLAAEDLLIARGDGELIDRAIRDGWPGATRAERDLRRRELCGRAMALLSLPPVWAAVGRIAEALATRGRLSGEEVRELYHGAACPAYHS